MAQHLLNTCTYIWNQKCSLNGNQTSVECEASKLIMMSHVSQCLPSWICHLEFPMKLFKQFQNSNVTTQVKLCQNCPRIFKLTSKPRKRPNLGKMCPLLSKQHWIEIPLDIKLSQSVFVFKSRLKTYLFRLVFN